MPESTCSIDGCERTVYARDWCSRHYGRWRNHGDPMGGQPRMRGLPVFEAFRFTMPEAPPDGDECWLWRGHVYEDIGGYGQFGAQGKSYRAHVVSFRLFVRELLPGEEVVRHTCDNPPCVLPRHLIPGTHVENVADKVARNRQQKGERVPRATLTADAVREIRALAAEGVPRPVIAARFGVNPPAISSVVHRRTWKHVP